MIFWAACDKNSKVYLYSTKPYRKGYFGDEPAFWESEYACLPLSVWYPEFSRTFSLRWEDEPIKLRLILEPIPETL